VTAGGYVYDPAWDQERARLAGIEAMWDPGTQALLASCGAAPGASVLEAGAGGGSVTEWLGTQVSPGGHVLAVDLDVRFVSRLASPVVQVRQADLVADDLPVGEFDLVHCRLVLEHLPARQEVLRRLVAALRPGGWLVVEDYDWTGFGIESADEVEERAAGGILDFMTAAGFDRAFGRRLVGELAAQGLEEVRGEGRALVIDQTHPGFAFFQLSFDQLAPLAVQSGAMREDDVAVMAQGLAQGGRRLITPTMVAALGRRPAA
jgi:SAM-dependent methyltransferase